MADPDDSPTYVLDDPRPIAQESPYTFFLPSPAEIAALVPGDLVQLVFRSIPRSEKWDAERMWVELTEIVSHGMRGFLNNDPFDIPQLKSGDEIRFEAHHIIATRFQNTELEKKFSNLTRSYWERCLVDGCVLNDGVPVGFLYREEPDMAEPGDKYPDSGWRIRGDQRDKTDEELEARMPKYVALGAVLNRDDSWLHLIDAPIGSRFVRDFTTGAFVPESQN